MSARLSARIVCGLPLGLGVRAGEGFVGTRETRGEDAPSESRPGVCLPLLCSVVHGVSPMAEAAGE